MTSGQANHSYYDTLEVAEYFGSFKRDLFRAEAIILDSLKEEIKEQPILEIGVGGGRITTYLIQLTRDYVGLDYSQMMIEFCREKFKDVRLVLCDARDMSIFEKERFTMVMFGFNGIDEVDPTDRLAILTEVHRLLKPNGIFVFSSHNLDWESIPSCFFPRFSVSLTPANFVKENALRLCVGLTGILTHLWTRIGRKGHAVFWEYEVSPGIALSVYYVRKEAQIRQLKDAGFGDINIIDAEGVPVDARNARKGYMLFYVARKV